MMMTIAHGSTCLSIVGLRLKENDVNILHFSATECQNDKVFFAGLFINLNMYRKNVMKFEFFPQYKYRINFLNEENRKRMMFSCSFYN
jgi:hypothetical protein